MKGKLKKARNLSVMVLVAATTMFAITACENEEDNLNLSSGGNSTIVGNVLSFASSSVYYAPKGKFPLMARLVNPLIDFVVPSAHAAVAGVVINVIGTDIIATTDEFGLFTLTDVEPGRREFAFTLGDSSVTFPFDVPTNSLVRLMDIEISDDSFNLSDFTITEN